MPFLIFWSGSFAVQYGDHLRSGIICGPIWGSFAVRDHLRSWDHFRTRTVILTLTHQRNKINRPVRRGVRWVRPHPPPLPQATKVHFFVDQRFGRLERSTLMKDHDHQHCTALLIITICCSKPSEHYEFSTLLLFLFFLNSDIL